jgi:hypothetical protein
MSFLGTIKEFFSLPKRNEPNNIVSNPRSVPMGLTQPPSLISKTTLQQFIGAKVDGDFGQKSREALLKKFINKSAPALTMADIHNVADQLGVHPAVIRAVRKVEAPRGAFDLDGRPTALFEKHVFGKHTGYRYNASYPDLSSTKWMPGTYGPASSQWLRLARACSLDPLAAFKATSFGAFQVLGVNATDLGYQTAVHMAWQLTKSELAHLECFIAFIKKNDLIDELRQCRAGSPSSCIPFVSKYNGSGYDKNNYHVKFAEAIALYD